MRGVYRRVFQRLAQSVERAEQFGDQPVGRLLGDIGIRFALLCGAFGQQSLEPARGLGLGGQDIGVIGRQPQPLLIARALGVGQFGQAGPAFVEKRVVEFDRQQVGIGEIAIVVRVFFRAHRASLIAIGIIEPRFLDDFAAVLDQIDLAARFLLDHGHDKPHRVDVLGFGAGAEFVAGLAHADVDVGAH